MKETVLGVVFRSFAGIHWGHDSGHPEDPPGAYFSGVFHIAQEIVPPDPGFGMICLSANSMFCVY